MSFTADRPRQIARAVSALLLAGSLLAAPGAARAAALCPGAGDVPTKDSTDAAAAAVTCLVNAERTSRGLPALRRDACLSQAADRFAADMVRRTFFAHSSPTGASLRDRLLSANYGDGGGWRAGEALGWGTGSRATPEALVAEWLASLPHRRILLSSDFRELGVGVAAGAPGPTHSHLPGASYALDAGVVTR